MNNLAYTARMQTARWLRGSWKKYWPLIKSLQTALLLITGLAGYLSASCPMTNWTTILA